LRFNLRNPSSFQSSTMERIKMSEFSIVDALPRTENNVRRLAHARPADWQNPKPAALYNLVVIGGGSAGLLAAIVAASLGGKVALIEKHMMGGDCLNVGCVPSKAIIRSAKVMGEIMAAHKFGIETNGATVHFDQVMERIRRVQADISHVDSVQRYTQAGVDVFLGEGRFVDQDTLAIDGAPIRFKKALIATGSRPYHPVIPGLQEAGFLTNESVWNLMEQPKRLAVIGGGPIGCELAQAFRRLGSAVALFHNAGHVLNREDADAAAIVQNTFLREGIQLVLNSQVKQVTQGEEAKVIHYECPAGADSLVVDEILVATGRSPNIEGLGLEVVGVNADNRQGVMVNDYMQTSNPRIYAAGDVAMKYKFTHAAAAAAKMVVQNALFYGHKKLSDLYVPWCTYTDPEIAHVGIYAHEAEEQGVALDTFTFHFDENDRAVADGEEEGFVKVHTKKGGDKILGATIVARQAGDMINEITLAMVAGIGLKTIGEVIHPYPTQAEAIARVAGLYTRTRLTPTVQKLFNGWMAFNRR
jgi:pyruvate/2-oxoglutarate dehydrogenase complex dihydrolipoamide dehydrogenase (E3) component